MLKLSEIRRFRLVDERNRTAQIEDLSVQMLEEDYPPIERIFFRGAGGETLALGWNEVRTIDWRGRAIQVADLMRAQPCAEPNEPGEVLLARDVLDALVLDLENRRTTRANDLWLEPAAEDRNKIVLRCADTSAAAVWRRLSFGWLNWTRQKDLLDWRFVEFLRGDAEAVKSGAGYRLRINRLAPGEIAQFVDLMPYLHAAELIVLLPDELAADVLELTAPGKQLQIFGELDDVQTQKITTLLAPETAANILKQLAPDEMLGLLERLPKDVSAKIVALLRYPEGTVGSIMTNDVVFAPFDTTVKETCELLAERLKKPNFVYFVYLVDGDENKILRGVLSLRRLFTSAPDERVADIMDKFVSTLAPLHDARTAAFRVIDSHLAAMPVTNERGELLGALTIDAAVSAVAPRSWRDQAPRIFS